jgi:hypothetical protein
MFRQMILWLVCVALSACTSVPVASLWKLSRIDFMTSDLNRMRVAITLPAAIKPRKSGVKLETKIQSGDLPPWDEKFTLVESSASADRVGLPGDIASTTETFVYRLPDEGIARLEKIRSNVKTAQAVGKKGSLSIGISVKDFCKVGQLPKGSVLITTYLASSETEGYVVVTKDVDVRSDATASKALDEIVACDG